MTTITFEVENKKVDSVGVEIILMIIKKVVEIAKIVITTVANMIIINIVTNLLNIRLI